jgi:hypothetical protein
MTGEPGNARAAASLPRLRIRLAHLARLLFDEPHQRDHVRHKPSPREYRRAKEIL